MVLEGVDWPWRVFSRCWRHSMVLEVVFLFLEALGGPGGSSLGAGRTRGPSGVVWLLMEALKGI